MNLFNICQLIVEAIKELLFSHDFLEAHRLPNRFVRSSGKLSMLHVITYLFYTSKQAMHTNIANIIFELPSLEFPKVSKQALSKARQGVLPSLFQALFNLSTDIFNKNLAQRKYWRDKYNIYAIDGSKISVPVSKSNFENYGEMFSKQDPKRRWSMALCSTIYDVCNDFIVHGLLRRYLASEREAALQHCSELEKLGQFENSIILFDRGYYSEKMFRYFFDKGHLCVMRIKDNYNIAKSCKGDTILKLFGDPNDGTEDIPVRVIAVPLDGGTTEYLATNIPNTDLPAADFKELYFLRWTLETKYNEIKNQLTMEEFSGATSTSVEQEFYLNLLLSNLAALIKNSADIEIQEQRRNKDNNYRYQANRAYIICRMKWFLSRFLSGDVTVVILSDIYTSSCKALSQIQPGRKCPRKKKHSDRERKHFNNRKQAV